MKQIKNFTEANRVLEGYIPGNRPEAYTLRRMKSLMSYLGNPQDKLRVIHVAGTSGKTSTAYYIAALLRSSGKNVGLSVSPHVVEVNERLQVNLMPINEKDYCKILSEFIDIVEGSKLEPTYFELLVALAYWQFSRLDLDYAVMEVGLGGSLDGTNVVSRKDKVAVITDIGLDHINILGDNLPEIAAHKAGIILASNEVFAYSQSREVNKVFIKRADTIGAHLNLLKPTLLNNSPAFLPLFQRRNFALARAAASYTLNRDYAKQFSQTQLLKAAQTHIPARMDVFNSGDKTIILDGAHNAQKLHSLITSIKARYPGQKVAALVSFVDGRGYRLESSLREIASLTQDIILTTFSTHQDMSHLAVEPKVLEPIASKIGFDSIKTIKNPERAFTALLKRPEKILVVVGSFYIMNEVMPLAKAL